jgi:HAD superfamily hydrolase (TIGR01509 family)
MLQAIIFDLNGVFIKSRYLSERIEEKYGVPDEKFVAVLKEVMEVARKPGTKDSFSLWEPHLTKLGINLTSEEFFNFWFSGEQVISEFIDFARSLKHKGVNIFILSNNFRERTKYYRENFPEIFMNVDKAYFSWETGFVKPDPKAYVNVINDNSLEPSATLYFDDSTKNIEVARNLGIKAYMFEGLERVKDIVSREMGGL